MSVCCFLAATAIATCPAGSFVTGGGFDIGSTDLSVQVSKMVSGMNSWEVTAANPLGQPQSFVADAICTTGNR